jgi:glucosamine 6-phosphate synthetase-like amidotransferase/phosphosugar isomerase protein
MSISSIISISLGLDKFFLSKKEKKRRKLEVINALNEASNSIQEILDLEENIEEMALILESNYKKANDSLDKAKDLIRVYV